MTKCETVWRGQTEKRDRHGEGALFNRNGNRQYGSFGATTVLPSRVGNDPLTIGIVVDDQHTPRVRSARVAVFQD